MQSHRSAIQSQLQHTSHGTAPTHADSSHPAQTTLDPASRGSFAARPALRRISPPAQRSTPCPVCRCTSVRLDEVDAGGVLHLAECPRCEHRWTAHAAIGRALARRGRVAFVPASRLDTAAQA